jgi:hypothetical protein
MLIDDLFSKLVGNHLFYNFFMRELQNSESVYSMYPQEVGAIASFTKIFVNKEDHTNFVKNLKW